MSLFRSFLLVTSIASSQAHTHTHTRQYRPSLLGVSSHSWDDVLLARTFARTQPELKLSESSGMKNEEDVAFSVDPIGIYASGLAHVNVSWSSKLMDIQDDIITVSCAEPEDTLFGDYFPVDSATSFKVFVLPRGVGCKFVFRYIRGATSYIGPQPDIPLSADGTPRSTAILVAEAKPLSLGNDTDPVGTRISFGNNPGEILFTFATLDNKSSAWVRVGQQSGGPYTDVFSTEMITYDASDMCHSPATDRFITGFVFPGYFHTANLTLLPDTRYYAVYGQGNSTTAPEATFRTRKAPSPDSHVKFVAFGDSATYPVYPGTVTTVDLIVALDADGDVPVDFCAIVGDLAYAEGAVLVWSLWTGFLWPISSSIPLLVTTGNHETNVNPKDCSSTNSIAQLSMWQGPTPSNPYGDDSGGEAGVATFYRYRGPSNGLGVLWYSFDIGSVHFVHWSSEHDYTAGSPQNEFLHKDLLSVDRSLTPWLVVAQHRPMYNSRDDGDWSINQGMVIALESLFVQAKVDLVISGHYHNYLRTTSMKNYTADPTGQSPVYITAGTGGATYHNESFRPDSLSWTAAQDAEWGFSSVEAFNRSHLLFSFHTNIDGGKVRDSSWIIRPERIIN